MANLGKPPCDEGVVLSGKSEAPCAPSSGPWILAATIIGSSMAFIDSTVTNVALPALQQELGPPPWTLSGSSSPIRYSLRP